MAYPERIKEDAFLVFTALRDFAKTAREMSLRHPDACPRLSRQAVQKWYEKLLWKQRLEHIDEQVRKQTNVKAIGELAQHLADLKDIRETIVEKIKTNALEFKSAEGAINCMLGIDKQILDITGERGNGKVNVEKMITVIFNVLSEEPRLSEIVAEKQAFIVDRVRKKLQEVGG